MEIYIVTKMWDNGDGCENSVIAVETDLSAARVKLESDLEELVGDYDVPKENIYRMENDRVEVINTDNAFPCDYVTATYEITYWAL